MNIKKFFKHMVLNQQGNALITSLFLMLAGSTALVVMSDKTMKLQSSTESNLSTINRLNQAHAITALLKQDIQTNALYYLYTKPNILKNCFGRFPIVSDYLRVFDGECQKAVQTFSYFKRKGSANQKSISPEKIKKYGLSLISPIQGTKADIIITKINSTRNSIIGYIEISSIREKKRGISFSEPFNIDVSRATRAVTENPSCQICKANPGGVCCTQETAQCLDETEDPYNDTPLLTALRKTFTDTELDSWYWENYFDKYTELPTTINSVQVKNIYITGDEYIDRRNGCGACTATVKTGLAAIKSILEKNLLPKGAKLLPVPAATTYAPETKYGTAWGFQSFKYLYQGEVYEHAYFYHGYSAKNVGGYDFWDGELFLITESKMLLKTDCVY